MAETSAAGRNFAYGNMVAWIGRKGNYDKVVSYRGKKVVWNFMGDTTFG